MTLILGEKDVERLLPLEECIEAMAEARVQFTVSVPFERSAFKAVVP